jgi:hypothetical protein
MCEIVNERLFLRNGLKDLIISLGDIKNLELNVGFVILCLNFPIN